MASGHLLRSGVVSVVYFPETDGCRADSDRVVILITFFIYIRAGREIYKKHKQLREFSSHHEPEPLPPMNDPFSSIKTTEVFVTSESVNGHGIDLAPLGRRDSAAPSSAKTPNAAYSVSISAKSNSRNVRESYGDVGLPIQSNVAPAIAPPPTARMNPNRQKRRAAYDANNAAWSYTKCAILFFTVMLVTWIPSSANRVYSVVHIDEISLPLEYMSAFVLPLQGFWNAIIYMVTSWKACQMLWSDMFSRNSRPAPSNITFRPNNNSFPMSSRGGRSEKNYESESMTELAMSRPNSNERR